MNIINSIKKVFNIKNEVVSEVSNPNQWAYHFIPEKSKYHDYSESYFIKPSSGKILRLTSDNIFAIISFQDLGLNTKQICESCNWGSDGYKGNITVEDIQLFLDEFNKGHMDEVIAFILDNEIEYNYDDKNVYYDLKKF